MSTSNSKRSNNFNHVVHLRLSAEQLEHIKAQADCAGITASRFIRDAATGVTIRSVTDVKTQKLARKLGGLCNKAIIAGHKDEVQKGSSTRDVEISFLDSPS